MVKRYAGGLLAMLLLSVVTGTGAQESSEADAQEPALYVPARFAEGTERAASQIEYPIHKGDIAFFMNCGVALSATGEVKERFCLDFYGSQDARFQRAARKFLRKAKFEPASVNGSVVPVRFYFRIFFGKQGTNYAVGVYPNWGDDTEKYGLDYVAPQQYEQPRFPTACRDTGGLLKILVDAEGRAVGETEMLMTTFGQLRPSDCDRWYMDMAKNGKYIPAMHEGKPVSAIHVGIWGDPDWISLEMPQSD